MREKKIKEETFKGIEELGQKRQLHKDRLAMEGMTKQDKVSVDNRSRLLVKLLFVENPWLREMIESSASLQDFMEKIRYFVMQKIGKQSYAFQFYEGSVFNKRPYDRLTSQEIASIRLLDYLDHSGEQYPDLNRKGEMTENHPFKALWLAFHYGRGGAKANFFVDMITLFRQFSGRMTIKKPSPSRVKSWMERHPSGLDPEIVALHEENKERILNIIIKKIDQGEMTDDRYFFTAGMNGKEKIELARQWWTQRLFHLRFAIRDADLLDEMLDHTLSPETIALLKEGSSQGIPVFVNPYYLSLLLIHPPDHLIGADQPIRDYIFYSRELLEEFGEIVAWEKEDEVEPGKPNAAGWILPNSRNLHRRYPDVAILIPDTVGRSCGGLCVSCQRMYDFQRGNLNFELDRLKPREVWWEKLEGLMEYFENDSQLCDILITGGDALMSVNRSLNLILDAVYRMAVRKKKANLQRPDGEKYAEIVRVRLGTRLPIYLPQRITDELVAILADFREKGLKAGIRQFVIQTHFETAMEITPEAKAAVSKLISAGWMVTNQQVFTASASRRGHTAKLRQALNDIGVLPYYTFTVKGYMENYHNFATNARAMQEMIEEKSLGKVPEELYQEIRNLPDNATEMAQRLKAIRKKSSLPFLATDKNVLNLPGVGKSMIFRTIGITRYGRRILEFDHDETRRHSPVIENMGKVIIIESKPIQEYLDQLTEMGEDVKEYQDVFCYSMGFSGPRMPVFKYPASEDVVTEELTNFRMR